MNSALPSIPSLQFLLLLQGLFLRLFLVLGYITASFCCFETGTGCEHPGISDRKPQGCKDGNFITQPADDQAALASCWMESGLGEQTRSISAVLVPDGEKKHPAMRAPASPGTGGCFPAALLLPGCAIPSKLINPLCFISFQRESLC